MNMHDSVTNVMKWGLSDGVCDAAGTCCWLTICCHVSTQETTVPPVLTLLITIFQCQYLLFFSQHFQSTICLLSCYVVCLSVCHICTSWQCQGSQSSELWRIKNQALKNGHWSRKSGDIWSQKSWKNLLTADTFSLFNVNECTLLVWSESWQIIY